MSTPYYRCLRQRDLSAKGCEPTVAYLIGDQPNLLPPTDGQLLRNMSYKLAIVEPQCFASLSVIF
ncbi:MAG: hypothetical protein LBB88_00510 [Planctomycetaceae bacterium]|nr:hypothetical protein [Planctomycetaceae bacterium]